MWGAIAGDVIGSTHEFRNPPTKTPDFEPLFASDCQFTDDTILTVGTAQAVLEWVEFTTDPSQDQDRNRSSTAPQDLQSHLGPDYEKSYLDWGRRYPSSYGGRFAGWLHSTSPKPYNSFGNGSAMRVSPIGWAFESLDETLRQARLSALPTHNHPEGIKGAQAVAHSIYVARVGDGKDDIRRAIEDEYGYDLRRTIDGIRPGYYFNETCQRTVPEAIVAFLESDDFESAIRLAISLGGDADTLACITGSIAEAYYGELPDGIVGQTRVRLPGEMLHVVDRFTERFRRSR